MTKQIILPQAFFQQDTRKVAAELLGKLLVREVGSERLTGVIVETEAYRGFADTASHAYKGPTERCRVMFGEAGRAYVYLTYGIHCMLNFVTERKFFPSAVLVRALQPLDGVEEMYKRRHVRRIEDLANGPGKLTQAFSIDRELNDVDITSGSKLWVENHPDVLDAFTIATSTRIGIDYADEQARDWQWRFFVQNNQFVSSSR